MGGLSGPQILPAPSVTVSAPWAVETRVLAHFTHTDLKPQDHRPAPPLVSWAFSKLLPAQAREKLLWAGLAL